MTRVKICGITNAEDARFCAEFGADALGFNFYKKSPRYIDPEKARQITQLLPKEILKVGVFVNENADEIARIAQTAQLDAIQLHGEESPDFVSQLKRKTACEIIKAFRVSKGFVPEDVLKYKANAILLDAYNPHEHGGTGETFDWEIARKVQEIFPEMYLAGGLSAANVADAIDKVKPFYVDACSSLEKTKGVKDKLKTIRFIEHSKKKNLLVIRDMYDVLSHIELMPEEYLGKKSLTALANYLHGFHEGVIFSDGNFDTKKILQNEFNEFVANELDYHSNDAAWLKSILKHCAGDEEKAFDEFFVLLHEYKEINKEL